MATGKVKWYNTTKGFGFIETDSGEDLFVHRSGLANINRGLEQGQKVSFDTQDNPKGKVAVNVTVIA